MYGAYVKLHHIVVCFVLCCLNSHQAHMSVAHEVLARGSLPAARESMVHTDCQGYHKHEGKHTVVQPVKVCMESHAGKTAKCTPLVKWSEHMYFSLNEDIKRKY